MHPRFCQVAVDAPGLATLDYSLPSPFPEDWPSRALQPGHWVIVPLGKRSLVGLVVSQSESPSGDFEPAKIRPIEAVCWSVPPVPEACLRLLRFTAHYYLRSLGQTAATALPGWLRQPKVHLAGQGGRRLVDRLMMPSRPGTVRQSFDSEAAPAAASLPALTDEQSQALDALRSSHEPSLLHGVTGSGKSRVYLERAADILAADPDAQVLVLVPEIGLTPVLTERFRAAFPSERVAVMHSGLTDRTRAQAWMQATTGQARILVGTRMAVLCPLPRLALIIVDEEHDTSYKQQEGLRYSARDLAVWLAADQKVPLILGSATPSLESRAQVARGRYRLLRLTARATGAQPARTTLIDLLTHRPIDGLSQPVREALTATLGRGQQALVFVNRRGWAPVLSCEACGWRQHCTSCSIPSVLHRRKNGWQVICHHCGLQTRPPAACPDCGATDLQPIGRGAQQIEETLAALFPGARLARLDRDAAHSSELLQETLARAQRHEIDLIVGTQMVAKGHDLPGLQLVVILEADAQLANPDFRAPEQLLATLTQVAGRAGRHPGALGSPGQAQVLIQTRTPAHPILQALAANQEAAIEAAWQSLLEERAAAGMPPYGHLAALRVAHREPVQAEAAITEAHRWLHDANSLQGGQVRIYPPVPRYPERVAGKTRWQLILEADQRPQLRGMLEIAQAWAEAHRGQDAQLEIDPLGLA